MPDPMGVLGRLTARHAHPGRLEWIGIRPSRRAPIRVLDAVEIALEGLVGDRRNTPGKRAVTLIQHEHLPAISALAGRPASWDALRRNLVVSGINLLALRKSTFRLGTAVLRGTGICAPCSRMEDALGPGGYNAVRGHGGITAEVVRPGRAVIGDAVMAEPQEN